MFIKKFVILHDDLMDGRLELLSLSGVRFFATLGIVLGHAIESAWIDDGTNSQAQWFSSYTCSAFRRSADDLVRYGGICKCESQ